MTIPDFIPSILKGKIYILFIFISGVVIAQNETNNWYFGNNAGLDFSNGEVAVHANGKMSTIAGCSSISDRDGNLLFYTNGKKVWNKNHAIMEDGDNLPGEVENTQTSIIIPQPGDDTVYYIFSTRTKRSTSPPLLTPGLYYSKVEINDQHPLGKVTLPGLRLTENTTERLAAIHDAQNNSIKVIAFGSLNTLEDSPKDTFFVFNVTDEGISRPPILSTQTEAVSKVGAMKISPDGKLLAIADEDGRRIYIYNFDVQNSNISYYKYLNTDLFMIPIYPYGVEFSQDSNLIYFTGKTGSSSFLFNFILKPQQSISQKILLASSAEYGFGSLQLARNGKIYMANFKQDDPLKTQTALSVINDPESLEDNDYQSLSLNLRPGESYKGLPIFVSSFLRNRIITDDMCVNEIFNFSLDAYTNIQSVLWEFGDGSTSTLISPTHQYLDAGEYKVKATIVINDYPVTLYKDIEAYPLPQLEPNQTLYQCDPDDDGYSVFNLYNIKEKMTNSNDEDFDFQFYHTYNDAIIENDSLINASNYINQSNPEEIFVKITSAKGCSAISNFFLETTYTELEDITAIVTCENSDDILNNDEGRFNLRSKENEIRNLYNIPRTSTLYFYKTFEDAQTKLDPLPLYYTTITSTIWIRIENNDFTCYGIEPIGLIVNSPPELNIEESYTICKNNPQNLILDGGSSNDKWEWKNEFGDIISIDSEFSITNAGSYSLSVYKTENGLECSETKQFTVSDSGTPFFKEIETQNGEISISVEGESTYEFSLDNSVFTGNGKTQSFYNVSPGIYTVYVRDLNGCEGSIEKEVSLIGFPKFFTPNGDGYNDVWKIYGVTKDFYSYASISIFDRYGKNLFNMNLTSNPEGWDGTYNGAKLYSTEYWYSADLIDLEGNHTNKKGHFSMIY